MSTQFKVNDIVAAFGCRGTIVDIDLDDDHYPIIVEFFDGASGLSNESFALDGRFEMWHREPSLKLVERPKRMVTKTIEVYINIYPDGTHLYYSKDVADQQATSDRIACVRLVGMYEVEEDV